MTESLVIAQPLTPNSLTITPFAGIANAPWPTKRACVLTDSPADYSEVLPHRSDLLASSTVRQRLLVSRAGLGSGGNSLSGGGTDRLRARKPLLESPFPGWTPEPAGDSSD